MCDIGRCTCEGLGCLVIKRAVWAVRAQALAELLGQDLSLTDYREQLPIENLLTERAVRTLEVAILPCGTWFDITGLDDGATQAATHRL